VRSQAAATCIARSCRCQLTGAEVDAPIGSVVSPVWTGVILVAANPRRAMLSP
jgi:hypothetical protein